MLEFLSLMSEQLGMTKFCSVVTYLPEDTFNVDKQAKIKEMKQSIEELGDSEDKKEEKSLLEDQLKDL